MAQTNLNIRMDAETKRAFEEFCNEIGMTVSTAINIFAKTVVREQRIPFELTVETPNRETMAALQEFDEMMNNPDKYKRYSSFSEAMDEELKEA